MFVLSAVRSFGGIDLALPLLNICIKRLYIK